MRNLIGIFVLILISSNNLISQFDASNTSFVSNMSYEIAERETWKKAFKLDRSTRVSFRYASQYKSVAAIISPDQLDAFLNFKACKSYSTFDGKYGVHELVLPAGNYFIAVRNIINQPQNFTIELDKWPEENGCSYLGSPTIEHHSLKSGTIFWQPVTIEENKE